MQWCVCSPVHVCIVCVRLLYTFWDMLIEDGVKLMEESRVLKVVEKIEKRCAEKMAEKKARDNAFNH